MKLQRLTSKQFIGEMSAAEGSASVFRVSILIGYVKCISTNLNRRCNARQSPPNANCGTHTPFLLIRAEVDIDTIELTLDTVT